MKKNHTEQDPATAQSRSPPKTAHPHDRLFKEVFSTREAQQDLVSMALPAEITSRFRMNTVRESSQETGTGRMDLLLTVETKDDTTEYVYVLVEHKSYRDRTVAVQLLGYVAGIMKKHGTLPMPVIHPRMHGRAAISTEWIRDQAGGVLPWCENLDRPDGVDRVARTGRA